MTLESRKKWIYPESQVENLIQSILTKRGIEDTEKF